MAMHPEIQQKAQQELDRVVGRDRLPELADRENLPYISALIKELLRSVIPRHLPAASLTIPQLAPHRAHRCAARPINCPC